MFNQKMGYLLKGIKGDMKKVTEIEEKLKDTAGTCFFEIIDRNYTWDRNSKPQECLITFFCADNFDLVRAFTRMGAFKL